MLITTSDCRHGATLSTEPGAAFDLTGTVRADDDKLAGGVLTAVRTPLTATVAVRHSDGTTTVVHVELP